MHVQLFLCTFNGARLIAANEPIIIVLNKLLAGASQASGNHPHSPLYLRLLATNRAVPQSQLPYL